MNNIMNNNTDDAYNNMENDTSNLGKKGGTSEAGVFRGLTQSIGQRAGTVAQKGMSMMRMPTIGRLPATVTPSATSSATTASKVIMHQRPIPKVSPSNFISRKVPVKQVVKVSDQLSQGISIIDSASESSTNSKMIKKNIFKDRITMIKTFASSLAKNTFLGIVVFEVYGAIVDTLLPEPNRIDKRLQDNAAIASLSTFPITGSPSIKSLFTTISIHSLGGFIGGTAHGVVATLWDSISSTLQHNHPKHTPCRQYQTTLHKCLDSISSLMRQHILRTIAHHGISHAVLFGSYELSKQLIFSYWIHNDYSDQNPHYAKTVNKEPMVQMHHLACIFVAGGFAGQAQHIVSHLTEKWLILNSSLACQSYRTALFPLLMSSFPSGIAFVALEYSRRI